MSDLHLNKTVTWSHVLSTVGLLVAGFAAWADQSERIVKLESAQQYTQKSIVDKQDTFEKRLDKIESKIDDNFKEILNKLSTH